MQIAYSTYSHAIENSKPKKSKGDLQNIDNTFYYEYKLVREYSVTFNRAIIHLLLLYWTFLLSGTQA